MLDLTKIKKEKEGGPIKALIYGEPGVGKSTFANSAPNPIFISAEGGLKHLECSKVNVSSFEDVRDALTALREQDHKFKTVVLDPIGWIVQRFEEDFFLPRAKML